MDWFWNTLWRWFGDWKDKDYHPPTPKDENATGIGWHGDRPEDHMTEEEKRRRDFRERFDDGTNGD